MFLWLLISLYFITQDIFYQILSFCVKFSILKTFPFSPVTVCLQYPDWFTRCLSLINIKSKNWWKIISVLKMVTVSLVVLKFSKHIVRDLMYHSFIFKETNINEALLSVFWHYHCHIVFSFQAIYWMFLFILIVYCNILSQHYVC